MDTMWQRGDVPLCAPQCRNWTDVSGCVQSIAWLQGLGDGFLKYACCPTAQRMVEAATRIAGGH